ncbi:metal ABC transporter ATP-binding protein [Olsenella urininfantis]|uniref:metal ABC transporter ATP-binding protein n=1 Tax=Olsenella urininfantis TaxID=1871033 RepID=UPI000985CDF0|nr:ATP-binding cassette domain-containing protein [Olsenella urininfantis]
MNVINVSDLRFGYTSEAVLRGVSLSVGEGDSCCITGENGSGKSTLLKVILGELRGFTGTVELFGCPIAQLRDLSRIAYVPQASVMNKVAFPTTCREMVSLGLYGDFGFVKVPRKRHFDRAEAALSEMGLGRYVRTPFNELSGGLQQRVMICRALVNDPRLLVLDEPTAGVDNESKVRFLGLLEQIRHDRNITVLLVSHELDLVMKHMSFDAIYRIDAGGICRA